MENMCLESIIRSWNFLNVSMYDLYTYLHNITRMVHPILVEETVNFQIKNQEVIKPLPFYSSKFMNNAKRKYLIGFPLTKYSANTDIYTSSTIYIPDIYTLESLDTAPGGKCHTYVHVLS